MLGRFASGTPPDRWCCIRNMTPFGDISILYWIEEPIQFMDIVYYSRKKHATVRTYLNRSTQSVWAIATCKLHERNIIAS